MADLDLPHTKLTVRRVYTMNKQEVESEILEGEVPMTQQIQDEYKNILGDAQARISIGRDLSELDFGSGGKVFVSVSLACDQSQAGIARAIQLADYLATGFVQQHFQEMRNRCVQIGLLKPPVATGSGPQY